MRKFNVLFVLILGTSLISMAQPAIDWQISLGGSAMDIAYAIDVTTDGGYIVVGGAVSNDHDVTGNQGSLDHWVVKLTSTGSIDWQKSLGGSIEDVAYSVQQTLDGGYIVAGYAGSTNGDVAGNHGAHDFWVIKLTNTGNMDWQKCLGGSGLDESSVIEQTSDGGYIIAGTSKSTNGDVTGNHGNWDYWVVKLDSIGTIDWQKSLGGSSLESASSVQQTLDGGYIIAGNSFSTDGDVTGNHGDSDYWVVKLDSSGTIDWQKCLGGSGPDAANDIKQTSDNGYIVTGWSLSRDGDVTGNHGDIDYWVVKLTSTGSIDWEKSLGGSGADQPHSIQQTIDGGYVVAGYTTSVDGDVTGAYVGLDYWVVKLTNTGSIDWQKCLGGSNAEIPYAIEQTLDGGYVVAGYSQSTDGDLTGNYGAQDYWIVKLSPSIVVSTLIDAPRKLELYPNPTKDQITLSMDAEFLGADYTIYNKIGQPILFGKVKGQITVIQLENLPSAVYRVQVERNGQSLNAVFVKGLPR